MENQEQKLLSTEQVAARLVIQPQQVYQLKRLGKISAPLKIGRTLRWTASALEYWIVKGRPALEYENTRIQQGTN